MSSENIRSRQKGAHRKSGKARRAIALTGTAAAAGLMTTAFAAIPANASVIPGDQTRVTGMAAVTVAATIAADHEDHLRHMNHLGHLAHLQWVQEQQKAAAYAAKHKVVTASSRAAAITPSVQAKTSSSRSSRHSVKYSGGGGFESCVIARESGGNSQVMNGSGHYGLYQFDLGTWESGGGSASSFGHASVAAQKSVFSSVYAARGASPWAPYDGC